MPQVWAERLFTWLLWARLPAEVHLRGSGRGSQPPLLGGRQEAGLRPPCPRPCGVACCFAARAGFGVCVPVVSRGGQTGPKMSGLPPFIRPSRPKRGILCRGVDLKSWVFSLGTLATARWPAEAPESSGGDFSGPPHGPPSPVAAPPGRQQALGRAGGVCRLRRPQPLPLAPSWTSSYTASSRSSPTPATPGRPRAAWPTPTWPVGSWLWPTPSCCSGAGADGPTADGGTAQLQPGPPCWGALVGGRPGPRRGWAAPTNRSGRASQPAPVWSLRAPVSGGRDHRAPFLSPGTCP